MLGQSWLRPWFLSTLRFDRRDPSRSRARDDDSRSESSLLGRLLLAGDRLAARPLAGPRIRVRALAAHGQVAAVPHTAIAADVHQALDVHGDVAAQVPLDLDVVSDDLSNPDDLVLGKVF